MAHRPVSRRRNSSACHLRARSNHTDRYDQPLVPQKKSLTRNSGLGRWARMKFAIQRDRHQTTRKDGNTNPHHGNLDFSLAMIVGLRLLILGRSVFTNDDVIFNAVDTGSCPRCSLGNLAFILVMDFAAQLHRCAVSMNSDSPGINVCRSS